MKPTDQDYFSDHCYWLHQMGLYETRYIIYSGSRIIIDVDDIDKFFEIRMEAIEFRNEFVDGLVFTKPFGDK